MASEMHTDPPGHPGVSVVTASSAEADVVVVGVVAVAEVVVRERAQPLPVEASQSVARTQKGPTDRWTNRLAP